jgi:ubiquinone/menaquinone biosynthesis C-methylase UbiE
MVISKEWNWAEVKDDFWNEPSEDVYYYVNRWSKKNYKQFLDLGCGLGRHSILFAQNGFDTYSFDLSPVGLDVLDKKAKEEGVKINTKIGDINKLPYESGMFDCLLAYHVISHTDTEGIKVILDEINRVLKKGGEFYITLCSKNSPSFTNENYIKIDKNTIVKTEEPEKDVPHFYSDYEDVIRLLKEFEIIRVRHIEDIFEGATSWHYFIHGRKL